MNSLVSHQSPSSYSYTESAEPLILVHTLKAHKENNALPEQTSKILGILLKQLEKLTFTSPILKSNLELWQSKISLEFFDDLSQEEFKKIALQSLAHLITQILHPLYLLPCSSEDLLEVDKIDQKLKAILESCLQIGIKADEFLKDYSRTYKRRIGLQKKNQQISANFQSSMTELRKAKPSIPNQLTALLELMKTSGIFSEEEKIIISKWEKNTPAELFGMLTSDDMKETASLTLCFLLCNVIHPALADDKRLKVRTKLAEFDKELKDILKRCLPQNDTVERIVKDFYWYANEKKVTDKKIKSNAECFVENMELLNLEANSVDQKIVDNFGQSKGMLLELIHHQKRKATPLYEEVDILSENINDGISHITDSGTALLDVAAKLQDHHNKFQEKIQDCKQLAGNLKI